MSKRRPRPTDGGGNWMDTYGDMVTLLLTFFIMLYSMSTLNQQKWEIFVKSIFPSSSDQEEIAINEPQGDNDVSGTLKVDEEIPAEIDMNTLYLTLVEKMNEQGIDGVTISRGEDYTFIMFEDKTFFDGDSSVLTDQGKSTLDLFCDTIAPAKDALSQINIMGHTSQGEPDKPNDIRTDRMLSAMRGAEVCIHIQKKGIIQPEKLVSTSYGQFRPVADVTTKEGRAKNRRVELLLIDQGADIRSLDEYYKEYNSGVNADKTVVTGGDTAGTDHGFKPVEASSEGVASTIPPLTDDTEETSVDTNLPSGNAADGGAGETTAE